MYMHVRHILGNQKPARTPSVAVQVKTSQVVRPAAGPAYANNSPRNAPRSAAVRKGQAAGSRVASAS